MAQAQVTAIDTGTTSRLEFLPGFDPVPDGIYNFIGPQINESRSDPNSFGGSSLAATSLLTPDYIEFQNGSASMGNYVQVTTTTNVDITLRNDTAAPIVPQLLSTITAAGLGIFVGNVGEVCRVTSVSSCGPTLGTGSFNDFSLYPGGEVPSLLARTAFDFSVLSDGITVYSLTGSLELWNSANGNFFVENLDDAAAALSGFGQIITDAEWRGFAWDATAVPINFVGDTLLAVGDSRTLSYVTTTTSYSAVACDTECLVAYGSFGDPVGRGAGIAPRLTAFSPGGFESFAAFSSDDAIAFAAAPAFELFPDIKFQTFEFQIPVFENGVLSFQPLAVPEPTTWAMLIVGFGLVGTAARRGRRPAGATQRWMPIVAS